MKELYKNLMGSHITNMKKYCFSFSYNYLSSLNVHHHYVAYCHSYISQDEVEVAIVRLDHHNSQYAIAHKLSTDNWRSNCLQADSQMSPPRAIKQLAEENQSMEQLTTAVRATWNLLLSTVWYRGQQFAKWVVHDFMSPNGTASPNTLPCQL